MNDFSHTTNAHPAYIEALYQSYRKDPESVDESWRQFFLGYDFAADRKAEDGAVGGAPVQSLTKEFGVMSIIHGFRDRGHLLSTTNPIRQRLDRQPRLDLNDYGLEDADLHKPFNAGHELGLGQATLQQILDHLRVVYCGTIGFEFSHIEDRNRRMWLRDRIENRPLSADYGFSPEKKKRILEKLNGASVFENFLHTKYIGQKRFSLEGGETTIPAIDAIINKATDDKVEEVVIGMAHRGRLNVLTNIMGKTYAQVFTEFEGNVMPDQSFGDGDVKYHLGFSSQVVTPSGKKVHLKLVPNPSHLESVDPVVEGFSRAKADLLYESDYDRILPLLIHGDAAVAGQGVVYEVAQMSQLPGYATGGTIHFVINNQIGFTTDFDEARSSTYCTDVAKVIQAPVFHVNGDDPEAVVFAAELATEYRQAFNTDVFIDMVCYRRHGHNEGDDPAFTQPRMYVTIKDHPNPRELYSRKLAERGDLEKELAEQMEKDFWNTLQERLDEVKEKPLPYEYQEPEEAWRKLQKSTDASDFESSPETGIGRDMLDQIIHHLINVPEGFKPLGKVNRLLKGNRKLMDSDQLNWAMGELVAYGSLLLEGKHVRMSGQDVRRGTFSHRHAVFFDKDTFEEYNRLDHLGGKQAFFHIYNSLLSEFAVLGFEYGYSMSSPDSLVIWEAQFGDFYNGAQTIIDQYITAAESKWSRQSGLVLLLPHGYEGQGPEHSSARLERFLQNCANYNMTVANATTPANFFHLLRRQLARPFRKPLVVMSPKSLLRHPRCTSSPTEFEKDRRFLELIDDSAVGPRSGKKIRRLLLCTGKVYYDLLEEKESKAHDDVAIIRVEQLYPLPETQLDALAGRYPNAEWYWVQEEPENMGAWQYMAMNYTKGDWTVVCRKPGASPATGYKKVHDQQQRELVEKAFA
jgi:2-oxoglutarate dehydrogenase E1 component